MRLSSLRPIPSLLTLVLLALIAAGCGSGSDADQVDSATAVSSSSTSDSAAPDDQPALDNSDTTGDQGEAAVSVTVEQVAGDVPEDVPSALDSMDDPAFPPPLVDPAEIRSGGPPPDGIPAIDNPRFVPASSVDWLEDNEPVIMIEVGGEARAYPVQIMTWHEIVNDTVGGEPVTVSYCPLCNSAIAYRRTVGDRVFDFGTSGRLYRSSLVMYDRQTESLWSHFTGEAVIGALTGTTLERLPVSTVSWSTFAQANPEALVLSRDTGYGRDYGRNPYPGYDDVNVNPFLFDGDLDGRLQAQRRVVAIRGETESLAIPLDELAEVGVTSTTIDGDPVLVLHAPGTSSALDAATVADGRDIGSTAVYRATVDGVVLELQANGDGTFTDPDSTVTYDITGTPVGAGDADAETVELEPVEHLDTFWFAIAAFEPDTKIVTP